MVVKVLDVLTDYPRLVVNNMVPHIVYECKTSVNQITNSVDSKALMEVLVQAYYCVNFYKLEGLLICLTDLYTWQYMKVLRADSGRLQLIHYKTIVHSIPLTIEELKIHFNFLLAV